MTATDELRRLLDERGVEWTSGSTEVSRNICTDLRPDTGVTISVWESGDGKLGIDAHTDYLFTPEQAIAATLGRGTCKARLYKPEHGSSDCTICECGEINDISATYCNRCGRRIKVVKE